MEKVFSEIIDFIRSIFGSDGVIPLHEPRFEGNEKEYLISTIDSTFVSSVGAYVDRFEETMARLTGAGFAVATVNGTAALHVALRLVGVGPGDEVITQPVSFVATANAISYCGARPLFLDVERETLGLSPDALEAYLDTRSVMRGGRRCDRDSGRRVAACVPVHVFGHPCRIDRIVEICTEYGLPVVEDAAEAMGSTYRGTHAGRFGRAGVVSFNGNKIVTCGGGGAILVDDEEMAGKLKHTTTTAKIKHPYEYIHDQIAFNYRLPNLNAALACAQLEQLPGFVERKRALADQYRDFFRSIDMPFVREPENTRSNYWLNAVLLPAKRERDAFLDATNQAGIMTRPLWRALCDLDMYRDCLCGPLPVAREMEDRIVNLPSSVPS